MQHMAMVSTGCALNLSSDINTPVCKHTPELRMWGYGHLPLAQLTLSAWKQPSHSDMPYLLLRPSRRQGSRGCNM